MDISDSCSRCGLRHNWRTRCSARNAECNKCHTTGHFGRVCCSAKRTVRKTQPDPQIKKQRDRRRMTEFLRRKDAMNLPFYQSDILEIKQLGFNSSLRSIGKTKTAKNIKSTVTRQINGISVQKTNIEHLRRERDALKTQLLTCERRVECIEEENGRLSVELQHAEEAVKAATDSCERTSGELQNSKETIEELKHKCSQLQNTIWAGKESQQNLANLARLLDESETRNKQIEAEMAKRQIKIDRLQNRADIDDKNFLLVKNNLMLKHHQLEIIKEETRERYTRTDDIQRGQRCCKRCGSRDRLHPGRQCPAYSYMCYVCHKKGHFTVFCDRDHISNPL